jgi:hypothetical protein
MSHKAVPLVAVAVLAIVVIWQELRIRDLESARAPDPGPTARAEAGRAPDRGAPPAPRWDGEDRPFAEGRRGPEARRRRAARALDEEIFGAEPEARSPLASRRPAADDAAPGAPEEIAELVAAEVDRRDKERWERRRERMIESTEEATREFATEHKLDEKTANQLAVMVTAEREQLFDIFRQARAGDLPFSEAREKADTLRGETDTNVEALLDDDAFKAYQERREEERGPWRRRGRR